MPRAVHVDVQVAAELADMPPEPDIREWLERAMAEAGAGLRHPVEISLRIVDETESRNLNRQYRNKDKPTNVLSFPLADENLSEPPGGLPLSLGDIVICGPVVTREACEQGKTTQDHWAHMLVHGALHLLGYDHETDREAEDMETLEARILALGGVENPYETRD